jgi:hypothetical protein
MGFEAQAIGVPALHVFSSTCAGSRRLDRLAVAEELVVLVVAAVAAADLCVVDDELDALDPLARSRSSRRPSASRRRLRARGMSPGAAVRRRRSWGWSGWGIPVIRHSYTPTGRGPHAMQTWFDHTRAPQLRRVGFLREAGIERVTGSRAASVRPRVLVSRHGFCRLATVARTVPTAGTCSAMPVKHAERCRTPGGSRRPRAGRRTSRPTNTTTRARQEPGCSPRAART